MKTTLTWPQHFERCNAMGISKKSYCQKFNLSYQLFFYHQRKFTNCIDSNMGFKEINMACQDFVTEIGDMKFLEEPDLQLRFNNGLRLLFSERHLDRVFQLIHAS
jgi:hypothetical protein